MTRYLHVVLIETEKDNADLVSIATIIHEELVKAGYTKPIDPSPVKIKTPFAGRRQDLINLFFRAFGNVNYLSLLRKAGLEYILNLTERAQMITVPALEDLPALSEDEIKLLVATVK